MQPRRRLCLFSLCALLAGLCGPATGVAAQAAGTTAVELSGPVLLAALRDGGYILYFRHTATDFGQNDEHMTGYEACDTQRNLTDAGRAEARAIGAALRDLLATKVPPGSNLVIASHGNPYRAVVGGDYLAEGEAAVIEPLGTEGFRIIAHVRKDAWKELAAR